jgi:two-component system NtrC family response regulator
MTTILVVDDMKNYLWMLSELLQQQGYEVLTSDKAADAKNLLADGQIDLLLTDLRMEEEDGMALLTYARSASPATSVIMMTAYGSIERAVEAVRLGAYDFVLKPFNHTDLLRSISKALERTRLVRENLRLAQTLAFHHRVDQLLGDSPAIREMLHKITRVTDTRTTVLITGETGSGKELVARAIHFNGPRCAKPFIAVNCGALVQSLAESELFGHERGAFTGAASRHAGLFEQADGGTLFLDEVSELPLPLQSKLLRVLETQELRRVGSEKVMAIDVRVLAATNRDLKNEAKEGRFREDLLFRLNVVRVEVPPLRDRPEDISLLAESYLAQLVRDGGVRGKRFTTAALDAMRRYPWPGNVRELQNSVAHAAILAATEEIQPQDLPIELTAGTGDWLSSLDRLLPEAVPLTPTLKAIEHHLIQRALARCQGVQAKAAELLGISRSLHQYKLKGTPSPTDSDAGKD